MASELIRRRPGGFDIRPARGVATAVADDVWLSEGLSNSYLIATSSGRVVINTGMGFEGPAHRAAYDAVSAGRISHVIFTQGHVDHVGGAGEFVDDETEVVAHAANLECQADDARIHRFRVRRSAIFWAEAVSAADDFFRAQPDGAPAPAQAAPTPTLTFDDQLVLSVGDRQLELLSVPGGETIDSLVVWLPQSRVAFI